MSEQVKTGDNSLKFPQLSEDEFIDINFKRICEANGDKPELINWRGEYDPSKYILEEVISIMSKLGLAKLTHVDSRLTKHGLVVKKYGGWIKYNEIIKSQKQAGNEMPQSFWQKLKKIHKNIIWIAGGIIMLLTIIVLLFQAFEYLQKHQKSKDTNLKQEVPIKNDNNISGNDSLQ